MDMWSMFFEGRYIMDLQFIEITDTITKVHDKKWVSIDTPTEYYLFD